MAEEKKKQLLEEASQVDPTAVPPQKVFDPPPPPLYHTWKRSRQRTSGQYTSKEARLVAKNITSIYSILNVIATSLSIILHKCDNYML